MISCLDNYIGVRGLVGYNSPESGYFINDLQGITSSQLDEIADETDHYDVSTAWADIYKRGSRLLEADIKKALKRYFKGYNFFENGVTGQLSEQTLLSQNSKYNGVVLNFGYESKNLEVNINDVSLYLTSAVNFSIYIFDLNTGQLLDTIGMTGSVGLKSYKINKTYSVHARSRLFIAYNSSVVSVYKMAQYKPLSFSYNGSVSTSANPNIANIATDDTGMSLTYNVGCSVSNFVCQRIDLFKDPFLYKLGVEFCNERIYSDRINRYTLMDKDDALALRTDFEMQYLSLLDAALKDLKVNENDQCFECRGEINYRSLLP